MLYFVYYYNYYTIILKLIIFFFQIYYEESTGEKTRIPPLYTPLENFGAKKFQSLYQLYKSKKNFKKLLSQESIPYIIDVNNNTYFLLPSIYLLFIFYIFFYNIFIIFLTFFDVYSQNCLTKYQSQSYIGYRLEGLTVPQILCRAVINI